MDHPTDDTLQAWTEATLPPREAEETDRHVAGCPACRESADAYRTVFGALEAEVPGAPEGFLDEVMRAVTREARSRPPALPPIWALASLGAAAAALVLLFGWFDVHGTALEAVPALSSEVAEWVPPELAVPASVEQAVGSAVNRAEGEWNTFASGARGVVESRLAYGMPGLAALALLALVNVAALWKLRTNRAAL
jgi:anti-sigma factor RsiW